MASPRAAEEFRARQSEAEVARHYVETESWLPGPEQ